MANTPDEPIRPNPDDTGPRDKSAKEPADAAPPPAKPAPPFPSWSDSSIDLRTPDSVDLGDAAVIEWASLAEQPASPASPPRRAEDTQVRSADEDALMADLADSGIDLAESVPARAEERPSVVGGEDSAIDLSEEAIVVEDVPAPSAEEDSGIDLREEAVVVEEAPAGRLDEDSAIDLNLDQDAVVVEGTVPLPGSEADFDMGPDSAVLRKGNAAAPPAGQPPSMVSEVNIEGVPPPAPMLSSSEIDLGLPGMKDSDVEVIVGQGSTSKDSDVEMILGPGQSGKDSDVEVILDQGFKGPGPGSDVDVIIDPGQSGSGMLRAPVGDSGIDLLAEDVILEEPTSKSQSGSGSGRDLIAEGLESDSGVHRGKTPKDKADDALEHFLAESGVDDQSSSVDLGSTHTLDVFEGEQAAGSDVAVTGAQSDVDLEAKTAPLAGRTKRPPSSSGLVESEIDIDLGTLRSHEDIPAGQKAARGARAPQTPDVVDIGEGAGVEEDELAEQERPAPQKKRGVASGWVGGGVVGTVLGAAACLGVLWAGGQLGSSKSGPIQPGPGAVTGPGAGAGGGPTAPQKTFAEAMEQIRRGDLDRVTEEDLARAEEGNNDQLVARAEHRWLKYLREVRGKDPRAPLNAQAEPVKQALADLAKAVEANHPDALLLRGQIFEVMGNAAAARADYQKGAQQFKADPEKRERFEAALIAMELRTGVARLLPQGIEPRMLALVLLALQADGEPAAPATPEAGYRFWQALKLARDRKFAEAVKAVAEARVRHDQRRYLLPRKPQNPTSDPREEIFLRACEALTEYWTILSRLDNPNYLAAAPAARVQRVDAIVKRAEANARSAQLQQLTNKLGLGKAKLTSVAALVNRLAADRKTSAGQIATLQKASEKQKSEIAELTEKLGESAKSLKTTADQLKVVAGREKDLQAANTATTTALRNVAEALGTKFVDVKTSGDALVQTARESKRVASVVDPTGSLRKLESELASARTKLEGRRPATDLLAFWRAHLQKDRDGRELTGQALKDVQRVLAAPDATEAQKAQALFIRGLALRNEGKFDEAQPALETARAALAKAKSPWLDEATQAVREVANPTADLAEKAQMLAARGQQKEALELLARSLKLTPGKKGALYAQRARIGLEAARARGVLNREDPVVLAAQKDAAEAAKEGVAEGHFVLGRLAEETGRFDDAVRRYREAIKVHGKTDETGSRYRVALARALLRSSGAEPVRARPLPPPVRTGKAQAPATGNLVSLDAVRLLVLFTLQAPGLPGGGVKASEAEKIADEILAQGDKVPFDVRAQAWAIKGMYTRALEIYATGLRERGLLAPEYANTLLELIETHPALRRPETRTEADPLAGERHYAAGLNAFAARRYADAERAFLAAVENDSGDARYFYFLGLSRLAQGKREAYEDFDQASRLERIGRPDRATVSSALERVQGSMRRVLNEVRNRPVKDAGR